ncbi:MAG: hypothetical protein NXH99_01400 [Rhodobacteraceae bacterium]|nr:hypothetical protein [Paracoccaceae bacterium]
MHLLRAQIRNILALLLIALMPVAAFSAAGDWSQISYPLEAQELNAQAGGHVVGEAVAKAGALITRRLGSKIAEAFSANVKAPNRRGELFSQRPTSFDPMNPEQFAKIQEAFARQGKVFDSSEDALRYLETRGADGVTFNAETILVRPDASPSTIFEVLIHSGQHRTGRYDQWVSQYGNAGATARAEYEAATRLVNNQRAYGISDAEHAVNQARVQEFGSQLDSMGIPRD